MSSHKPTPYAWAPTHGGKRLAHSIDQPPRLVDFDSGGSSGLVSSENSTPARPVRGYYAIPSSDEEQQPSGSAAGSLFARRFERQQESSEPEVIPPNVVPPNVLCTCGRCEQMPHRVEDRCCQREALDHTHLEDYQRGTCLLECTAVQHVISKLSVQLAWLGNMRYFGHTGDALNFGNMTNKNFRHFAYRNYIDLVFGKLGRHNRRVIPSCIVLYIRKRWPDPEDNYIGFVDVDEFGQPIDMDEAEGF